MLNITHYQRNEIKTTVRYHLMPVRMATIKISTNNKCWRGCGEKGPLLHCWRECNKLKIDLPYDPAIPPLGWKNQNWKRHVYHTVHHSTVTITRTWKQAGCPTADEWIRKLWHTYMVEYYSAIKKEHIWISSNEVDETGAYYTEWSKSERKIPIQYINACVYRI